MNTTIRIEIAVRGRLSDRLAAAFDGLTPINRPRATQLVGEVADQAQLHSLLTLVRDLGLDLESVTVSESARGDARSLTQGGRSSSARSPIPRQGR